MKISKDLSIIIISAFLFILSFVFKNISLFILIITYLLIGYKVIIKVIHNLSNKIVLDENFLMVIATIGAFIIGEYYEAVAVMLFYQIGEYLNDLGIDKSKDSIKRLIDQRGDRATLIIDEEEKKVDPQTLNKGDIILVRPGERIPIDGVVKLGVSNVDTSSITGESTLKNIKVNDLVYGGFVNMSGSLQIEVTSSYDNSLVSKILKVIEDSDIDKSHTEKIISKFAKIYTPIVVISALLLFIIPTLFLGLNIKTWGYRSLIFLVASCPCALVLSIPLGYFCGLGTLSKKGILVKGSNDLEQALQIKSFVFDKTGTLTKGIFTIKEINPYGVTNHTLLKIASYAEYYSNHPIALSIKNFYGKKINPKDIKNFKEGEGGISVLIANDQILLGNYAFLKKHKVKFEEEKKGQTIVYVAKNKKYIGNIIIGDQLKEQTYPAIKSLQDMGNYNLAILSGDNKGSVKEVADQLSIEEYHYDLKPLDKKNYIADLKKDGKVCFVGDGINDAIVLLESDLGISMGELGSDAAIEASDVVIMNDNLMKIIDLLKISKYTRTIIYQNIIFAILVKLIVLLLGIFGCSTIIMAVFADIGVTIITVINSLRIFCKKM